MNETEIIASSMCALLTRRLTIRQETARKGGEDSSPPGTMRWLEKRDGGFSSLRSEIQGREITTSSNIVQERLPVLRNVALRTGHRLIFGMRAW
jgi:hypothetical protein